jgi:hypothetical protein
MAAFSVVDGRARLSAVQVLARNGRDAAIGKGLEAGAMVVVYAPPGVRDGTRVKIRSVGG